MIGGPQSTDAAVSAGGERGGPRPQRSLVPNKEKVVLNKKKAGAVLASAALALIGAAVAAPVAQAAESGPVIQADCGSYVLDFWTVYSQCRAPIPPAEGSRQQAVLECFNTQDPSQRYTRFGPASAWDYPSRVNCADKAPPWHTGKHFVRILP
ncbi:hypothetical protein ACPZ19_39510 [Amycolatopsis lurida]